MKDTMYETLLGLPLFAGISREKLSEIIGKNKFHFLRYAAGETIISAGESCTHLKSIISGEVRQIFTNEKNSVRVSQTLQGPDVIAPEYFFGKVTDYPCAVIALTDVGVLQIDKADYLRIINTDPVFLLNYVNILSMHAQFAVEGVMALTSGDIKKRIAYWIIALSQANGSDIVLECRQRDMYAVFGVPRQSLLAALDEMVSSGMITYTNEEIRVIDRRKLVDLLTF